jgi:FkbH-like protein
MGLTEFGAAVIDDDAIQWGFRLILGRNTITNGDLERMRQLRNNSELVDELCRLALVVPPDNASTRMEPPTKDAVTWAYRLFLDREPESDGVVQEKMSLASGIELLRDFLLSSEFSLRRAAAHRSAPVSAPTTSALPMAARPLGPRLEGLNILAIGPCILEELVASPVPYGHTVTHYLMSSASTVSDFIQIADFDVVLVALVFRGIWKEATGQASDVIHVRAAESEDVDILLERGVDVIRRQVSTLHPILSSRPTFFLSFLEPSFSYLGSLADPVGLPGLRALVTRLNEQFGNVVREHANFHFLDLNQVLNAVGRSTLQDDAISHFSHNSILGASQRRRVSADTSPPTALKELLFDTLSDNLKILRNLDAVKLIVVDLDNTLWRGTPAEDGDSELADPETYTEGWPLGFAEALLYFRKRGGLLAICSRNDHDYATKVFARLWRSNITLDDFVSIKINYGSKAANITEILAEVNVLAEHTLFIDDNPRELDEVKASHPRIRCLGPPQEQWRQIILRSPETQVPNISAESSRRTQSVRALISRSRSTHGNRTDWLRSLDLVQRFFLVRTVEHPLFNRSLELLNKTNQFNTTGTRWSLSELRDFFHTGGVCLLSALRDKIDDNGVVGVALLKDNEIAQVALSCRVFGLGAEIGLGRLAAAVALKGSSMVVGRFVDTGKNFTCRDYFKSLGFIGDGNRFETTTIPEKSAWVRTEFDRSCDPVGDW